MERSPGGQVWGASQDPSCHQKAGGQSWEASYTGGDLWKQNMHRFVTPTPTGRVPCFLCVW